MTSNQISPNIQHTKRICGVATTQVATQAKPGTPAFVLYSGHDTGPMGPVLAALKIGGSPKFNWQFPHFGDLISFELHRLGAAQGQGAGAGAGYAVRVVHDGEVVTELVDGCPAGEQLCPYSTFHKAAAALVPTPEECGRDDAPEWWPRPSPAAEL